MDSFDAHDPDVFDAIIKPTQRALLQWPSSMLRPAPHMWVHRVLQGNSVPQMCLANALNLIGHCADEAQLVVMFHSDELRTIRYMDLRAGRLGHLGVIALSNNPWLHPELQLDIRHAGVYMDDYHTLLRRLRLAHPHRQILWNP